MNLDTDSRLGVALQKALIGASLLFLLFSLMPWVRASNVLTDIPSHFTPIWMILALVAGISMGCIFKRRNILLATILTVTICVMTLLTTPTAVMEKTPPKKTLSIYQINTQTANASTSEFISSIQKTVPDIILIAEVNSAFRSTMRSLHKDYPYSIDNGKTAILAKFKLANITKGTRDAAYFIGADIIWGRDTLSIATFHPPTPLKSVIERDAGFIQATQWIETRKPEGFIIAGDFNATPYAPIMRKFMAQHHLQSASQEVIKAGTYPAWLPAPLRLPIDHILLSDKVALYRFSVEDDISSDHLPSLAIVGLR